MQRVVAVAYSGGIDSTALLHASAREAAALGGAVVALHVHHGLSTQADAWLAHCEALCRRWARRGLPVELAWRRLESRPAAGESVEAWARGERYRALGEMARERSIGLVLLAHHRRDQAETFLLQALRGGSVAALAAMPPTVRRDGLTWARPWLAQPREAIEAYARRHRLRWIDDDSNVDDRFARNRLRRHAFPALVAAFADAEATLAVAAERAAHASAVLAEVAASDVAAIADEGGLDLARWRQLSAPRQRQALVAWLRDELAAPAPATLIERLLREVSVAAHRRWPIADGELRSYRGRLQRSSAAPTARLPGRLTVDLSRPGVHEISLWQGSFRVERVERGGIASTCAERLVLRARAPGDRFQAGARRPARSLKLQYQARGVAPALRGGPIVCGEDDIPMFIPGLGIDARAVAAEGQAQVTLVWVPGVPGERARSREVAR